MKKIILEACVENLHQAILAESNGADRIELCSDLHNFGTTPSYGIIKKVKEKLTIPVNVIIRPRAGNFIYTQDEIDIIKYDIELCKSLNIDGIVIGVLKMENNDIIIDIIILKQLIELAKPMKITFHMAFDEINDKFRAINELTNLSIDRILTKGCNTSAVDGIEAIKDYIKYASNKIIIMPGGGVNKHNYKYISESTGAYELHGTKIV